MDIEKSSYSSSLIDNLYKTYETTRDSLIYITTIIRDFVKKFFDVAIPTAFFYYHPGSFFFGGLAGVLYPNAKDLKSVIARITTNIENFSIAEIFLNTLMYFYCLPYSPYATAFVMGMYYGNKKALAYPEEQY
jgi:hypothetical protein